MFAEAWRAMSRIHRVVFAIGVAAVPMGAAVAVAAATGQSTDRATPPAATLPLGTRSPGTPIAASLRNDKAVRSPELVAAMDRFETALDRTSAMQDSSVQLAFIFLRTEVDRLPVLVDPYVRTRMDAAMSQMLVALQAEPRNWISEPLILEGYSGLQHVLYGGPTGVATELRPTPSPSPTTTAVPVQPTVNSGSSVAVSAMGLVGAALGAVAAAIELRAGRLRAARAPPAQIRRPRLRR